MPDGATIDQNSAGPDGMISLVWSGVVLELPEVPVIVENTLLGLTEDQDSQLSSKAGWGDSWV